MILFLYESLILGAVGSLIGIILSLIIGQVALSQYSMSLPLESLIYILIKSVLIGVGVSVMSALYPAYKASKLDPIEALKNE
jgi:putative ABC transport system permease protein